MLQRSIEGAKQKKYLEKPELHKWQITVNTTLFGGISGTFFTARHLDNSKILVKYGDFCLNAPN